MTKKELRKWMKEEFKRHDDQQLRLFSADVCSNILSNERVRKAGCVLAFWPMPTEPDIRSVVRSLAAEGKTVLLPRVISDTEMEFCAYDGDESLRQVPPYGIMEPSTPAVTDIPSDAVMLVPGVAFDAEGHRLGHGCGYYDRYLSQHPMPAIPVFFPFQLIVDVPVDEYDIIIKP